MKLTNSFITALAIVVTAGINVSVMAETITPKTVQGNTDNPITETSQPQQSCHPIWHC